MDNKKYKPVTTMSKTELCDFVCQNFSYKLYDRLEHNELYEAILLLMEDIVEERNNTKWNYWRIK